MSDSDSAWCPLCGGGVYRTATLTGHVEALVMHENQCPVPEINSRSSEKRQPFPNTFSDADCIVADLHQAMKVMSKIVAFVIETDKGETK